MHHIKWPKIYGLGTMLKQYIRTVPREPISYRAKVKLHGTNAGIHVAADGSWWAMSRKRLLGPTGSGWSDNHGFAAWAHAGAGQALADRVASLRLGPITVFGEWCGGGIQRGVASNSLQKKTWFPFGIRTGDLDDGHRLAHYVRERAGYIVEPQAIRNIIGDDITDIRVIPWHTWEGQPNGMSLVDQDSFGALEKSVRQEVIRIGVKDPLIEALFGITGPGEGLVMFAMRSLDKASLGLTWKSKSEQFAESKPVTRAVDASTGIRAQTFIESALTAHRIEKAWDWVTEGYEDPIAGMPGPGGFVKNPMGWMSPLIRHLKDDITSECGHDMSALQLSWNDIGKRAGGRVREWLFEKIAASD